MTEITPEACEKEVLQVLYEKYQKDPTLYWDVSDVVFKYSFPLKGVLRSLDSQLKIKTRSQDGKQLCAIRMHGIAEVDKPYLAALVNKVLQLGRKNSALSVRSALELPVSHRGMANDVALFMFEAGIAEYFIPRGKQPEDVLISINSYYQKRDFSFDQ